MDKLSVWYNGCDWVVAESAEDAALAYRDFTGDPPEDCHDWERLDDGRELPIVFEELSDVPSCATDDEKASARVVRTCAEWSKINGRGFLCSTEY